MSLEASDENRDFLRAERLPEISAYVREGAINLGIRSRAGCVPVSTGSQPQDLSFNDSPTIRVNGKEVELGRTSAPGLACRLHANRSGIPSAEAPRRAVSEAKCEE